MHEIDDHKINNGFLMTIHSFCLQRRPQQKRLSAPDELSQYSQWKINDKPSCLPTTPVRTTFGLRTSFMSVCIHFFFYLSIYSFYPSFPTHECRQIMNSTPTDSYRRNTYCFIQGLYLLTAIEGAETMPLNDTILRHTGKMALQN